MSDIHGLLNRKFKTLSLSLSFNGEIVLPVRQATKQAGKF